jgi:ABC-type sugar transport system ATPase subunit
MSSAAVAALAVSNLTKSYGATVALRGVDLEVAAGGGLALLGRNGAGKSTLIKLSEIVRVADEFVNLRNGAVAEQGSVARTSPSDLVRFVVGEDEAERPSTVERRTGGERLLALAQLGGSALKAATALNGKQVPAMTAPIQLLDSQNLGTSGDPLKPGFDQAAAWKSFLESAS